MNQFQREAIKGVAARVCGESKDKRAAVALRTAHAHAEFDGRAISLADLEHIMVAFGASRELRHP